MTDTTNNYQSDLAFHFFSIGTFVVSETVPMIMFMYIHMKEKKKKKSLGMPATLD